MSKAHAFFLALLVSALIAVLVPASILLWGVLLRAMARLQASDVGVYEFGAAVAVAAMPCLYVLFRRM